MSEMIDFPQTSEIKQWLGTGSINFFGIPFAGKDSQANRMDRRFGGTTVSSGDIFRNSVIPDETKAIMESGALVPTEDFIRIVLPYLKQDHFVGQPLMLSSVGRWHGEEDGVIGALEESHHPLKAVVYLSLDEAIAFERLHNEELRTSRGDRADDTAETLRRRIDEFNEKTLPVIDYYREKNLLIEVDASLPKDEVELTILKHLAVRALSV